MTTIDYEKKPLEELLDDETSPSKIIYTKLSNFSWMDFDDDIAFKAMTHKNSDNNIKQRCFMVGMQSDDVSLYDIIELWFSGAKNTSFAHDLISTIATTTRGIKNKDKLFSSLTDIIKNQLTFVDFSFLQTTSINLAWAQKVSDNEVVKDFFTAVFEHPAFDIVILKDLFETLKSELFDMFGGAVMLAITASNNRDTIMSAMYKVTSDVRFLPKECIDIFFVM